MYTHVYSDLHTPIFSLQSRSNNETWSHNFFLIFFFSLTLLFALLIHWYVILQIIYFILQPIFFSQSSLFTLHDIDRMEIQTIRTNFWWKFKPEQHRIYHFRVNWPSFWDAAIRSILPSIIHRILNIRINFKRQQCRYSSMASVRLSAVLNLKCPVSIQIAQTSTHPNNYIQFN